MSEGQHDDAPPGRALWERAERERVVRGWSQEELAERIGITRVTLMRLKTQANKPQAKTVKKVADGLGISLEEAGRLAGLLNRETPATTSDRASQIVIDEIPLDELLAQIPERRRRQLEQIRDEERARYQRQVEQAREEYQRSMSRIGKIAQEEADN